MKTVLIVEDNEDDAFLIKSACRQSGIRHRLAFAQDGEQAIQYLSGTGKYKDRVTYPMPELIFLDVKMPKRDGYEVLSWIRNQRELQSLPVIMLTGSNLAKDVNRAYELGATSFLQKMHSIEDFRKAIDVVLRYWLALHIARPQ